jgi:hypothetical protein
MKTKPNKIQLQFKKQDNFYTPADFFTKRYFQVVIEPRRQPGFKLHKTEMKVLLQADKFDIKLV